MDIFFFSPFPLNNGEKRLIKLAPIYVIDSQSCIRKRRDCYTNFLKFPKKADLSKKSGHYDYQKNNLIYVK